MDYGRCRMINGFELTRTILAKGERKFMDMSFVNEHRILDITMRQGRAGTIIKCPRWKIILKHGMKTVEIVRGDISSIMTDITLLELV
jgi:hypothetical protein